MHERVKLFPELAEYLLEIFLLISCHSQRVDIIFNVHVDDGIKTFEKTSRNSGVTVNIHSPKKALPNTYLLANKYSPVFFSQDKKTPGSVYLPVNKYKISTPFFI